MADKSSNMNQLLLEGEIKKISSDKKLSNGTPVVSFVISVTTKFNWNNEVHTDYSYFDCDAYGEQLCQLFYDNYMVGKTVRIVGRLRQNRWKDDSGKTMSKVYVIVEHIEEKQY